MFPAAWNPNFQTEDISSNMYCSLELCEDKLDWFNSLIMTQPVVIQMRHSFLKHIS